MQKAKTLEEQIGRAKELLRTVRHAAMATVNADGTPHNTPFLFMRDETLEYIYWGSHPDSEHSKNVLRTGQLFVVLYDAIERGGLYLQAVDGHPAEGKELEKALEIYNGLERPDSRIHYLLVITWAAVRNVYGRPG